MKKIFVEVVILGYHDPRIGTAAPYAFALRTAEKVTVHQRTDIAGFKLPEMFDFVARNLAEVVLNSTRDYKPDQGSLHSFLVRNCFNTLGSFRCWQPIEERVPAEDLEAYVAAIKALVDAEMFKYRDLLQDYDGSCTPNWKRAPQPSTSPMMPALR